jgi:hypothetical protein
MTDTIDVLLTLEETNVCLTLMQAGVRSFSGDQFDQASVSYHVLRQKILAARTLHEQPKAPNLAAVK